MKNERKKLSSKTLFISAIIFFLATLIIEAMRQILPRYTAKPPITDGILTFIRSLTFIIFAITLNAVIFPLLRKRFGKMKAVFFTIYSDCAIGFIIGMIITTLAGSQNSAAFGMTPLESIYYYFLGTFIMLISVLIVFIGMITYGIWQTINARKMKTHQ
ncbi:MAG: hypothetical protein IKJ91_00820 [Clostridia bacterium]|nr:hypothetical protein [Clostridia bacterium]